MGYRFNAVQKEILDAVDGAYSVVTLGDEDTKGQITITANEIEVVENWFGKDYIHTGAANQDIEKSTKQFQIYGTGHIANLKLVYPKAAKTELRLYMNKGQGFRPKAGDVWFVYRPVFGANIMLGYMSQDSWTNLASTDIDDTDYQVVSIKPAAQLVTVIGAKYPRSSKVAMDRMIKADFKCEIDPNHLTFISATTGNNYVEPHHLVPMMAQSDFANTLDVESNIVVLCPTCHRAMHLSEKTIKRQLLTQSYDKHFPLMNKSGIEVSLDKLLQYYNL